MQYFIPSSFLGLHLQPELDQAADGFRAVKLTFLTPSVNLCSHGRRKTYGADGIDPTPFLRATSRFLVYGN
jgi:hypothetical protein